MRLCAFAAPQLIYSDIPVQYCESGFAQISEICAQDHIVEQTMFLPVEVILFLRVLCIIPCQVFVGMM